MSLNLNLPPLRDLKVINDKTTRKWISFFRRNDVLRYLTRVPYYVKELHDISTEDTQRFLRTFVVTYENLSFSRGPGDTVGRFKTFYGVSSRFAADHEFDKISYCKCDSDGLPLMVEPLKKYLQGSFKQRQGALHLLQLYKLAEPKGPDPSLESITDKFKHTIDYNGTYFGEFLEKVMLSMNIPRVHQRKVLQSFSLVCNQLFPPHKLQERISKLRRLNDLYVSYKKGPNATSVGGAPIDWIALKKDRSLLSALIAYTRLTKNKPLLRLLYLFRLQGVEIVEPPEQSLGDRPDTSRLSIKIESGGKTRLFAICDWFSQCALNGLHHLLFSLLKGIPEDGTFNQGRIAEIASGWTTNPISMSMGVYSLDLKTATDRLPVAFQGEILSRIIGKEASKLWLTIASKRQFREPFNDSLVTYAVGQPMGLLSSWAMLALTNHVVCRMALKLSGTRNKELGPNYVVLGDDVALVGKQTSMFYHEIMNDYLAVPISPTKGFTSETFRGINPIESKPCTSVEIAKRIIVNGREITPVSPVTVKTGLELPSDFPPLIDDLLGRKTIEAGDLLPAILLGQLCYKAEKSLELATFPPLARGPFKDLLGKGESELPLEISNLIWFKTPGLTLEILNHQFKRSLRGMLIPTIALSIEQILRFERTDPKMEVAEYLYVSKSFKYLLRSINRSLTNKLDLLSSDIFSYSAALEWRSLKRLVSTLSVCAEMEDAVFGKPKTGASIRRKTSKVTSEIVKQVATGLVQYNPFTMNADIADIFLKGENVNITALDPRTGECDYELIHITDAIKVISEL